MGKGEGDRQTKGNLTETAIKSVLIVDDHPLVQAGLSQVIEHEPDLEVCATAERADQALAAVEQHSPDLLLLDSCLGGENSCQVLKQIKATRPDLPVVIVSVCCDPPPVERAIRAGARALVTKGESPGAVIAAVRCVLEGGIYMPEEMVLNIVKKSTGNNRGTVDRTSVESLAGRELEVYELLGAGMSTQEIASQLNLSERTIQTYERRIKSKLNLHSWLELVHHATLFVTGSHGE